MPPPSGAAVDKKTNLIIVIGVAVILLFGVGIPLLMVFWPDYEQKQILKTGTPAQGEITRVEPTGSWVNNQPETRVTVRVMAEGLEPYEATVTMIINPVYLPQFQPGKKVFLRYDPENPSKIAIEETEDSMRQLESQ